MTELHKTKEEIDAAQLQIDTTVTQIEDTNNNRTMQSDECKIDLNTNGRKEKRSSYANNFHSEQYRCNERVKRWKVRGEK